jgi:predicted RNA-binding Zn-ribbon protein involved in translation (DUF1610 family)
MDLYIQSIVSIRNKLTNKDISYKTLSLEKIISKFSNTKKPIYKLVLDDKPISRNNSLLVKFLCQTCKVQQEITLNLFMRKVNKEATHCVACRNTIEEKCEKQSQFMKENAQKILSGEYEKKKKEHITLELKLQQSINEWSVESDDFKDSYNHIHLTEQEFENIRNRILSVTNGKLNDLSGWQYFPHFRVFNQTRYTPMLINKEKNLIEKPYYVSFNCENCGSKFTHRDLEIVKNKIKIFCKECTFTNKVFRLRSLTLKNGNTILWQSIPERRFIEWCEEQSILIQNGPRIPYIFQEKERHYSVDFELPQLKKIVEIKDNHCWHKKQLESGKFSAKENAANLWAQKKEYTFHVVFPKTLSCFKKQLLFESCKI